MNRCISFGLLLLAALCCHAQESDPHDPTVIALGLEGASVVVVGKFAMDSCWPWFDGWHCSGAIHVEESLYGDRKRNDAVPFRWKEPYGSTCMICQKVSMFDGQGGIWFLARKNGAWRLSGTTAVWCGGPLPMDSRNIVVQCIRRKAAK